MGFDTIEINLVLSIISPKKLCRSFPSRLQKINPYHVGKHVLPNCAKSCFLNKMKNGCISFFFVFHDSCLKKSNISKEMPTKVYQNVMGIFINLLQINLSWKTEATSKQIVKSCMQYKENKTSFNQISKPRGVIMITGDLRHIIRMRELGYILEVIQVCC